MPNVYRQPPELAGVMSFLGAHLQNVGRQYRDDPGRRHYPPEYNPKKLRRIAVHVDWRSGKAVVHLFVRFQDAATMMQHHVDFRRVPNAERHDVTTAEYEFMNVLGGFLVRQGIKLNANIDLEDGSSDEGEPDVLQAPEAAD